MDNIKKISLTAMTLLVMITPVHADIDARRNAEEAHARGDHTMELNILKSIAEKGETWAQFRLGELFESDVPLLNWELAAKWHLLAANKDYAPAQVSLGEMYRNGYGVEKNETEAAKWFRRAADQGNAAGQFALGEAFRFGSGVPEDDTEAAKWYLLSAVHGLVKAQKELGFMYAFGQGVTQDYVEAAKWFTLAGNQGDSTAQSMLGVMYLRGEGVSSNYSEALRWSLLSAEQDEKTAQATLGGMFERGQGIQQDYLKAHMWYNLASTTGLTPEWSKKRDEIAAKMSPVQIAEAQKLARECRARKFKDC